MSATFASETPVLVAGATGPAITFTFTRFGTPVSLAGATVTATIHRGNLTTLHKTLSIVGDGTAGQAQLQWSTGDLAVAPNTRPEDVETYNIDFQVTTSLGTEVQALPWNMHVRPPVG